MKHNRPFGRSGKINREFLQNVAIVVVILAICFLFFQMEYALPKANFDRANKTIQQFSTDNNLPTDGNTITIGGAKLRADQKGSSTCTARIVLTRYNHEMDFDIFGGRANGFLEFLTLIELKRPVPQGAEFRISDCSIQKTEFSGPLVIRSHSVASWNITEDYNNQKWYLLEVSKDVKL